jgi:hypothetical protein
MLEFMTMAVVLMVGLMGGAIIGGVYVLRRKVEPDGWAVVEGWEHPPVGMFSEPRTAKLHIANEIARGNVDAHAYVVRGVVLVREEGDPR